MHFRKDEVPSFLELFDNVKDKIKAFDGCRGVDLLKDINQPEVMFTYSHWESEEHLNRYRDSELFGDTWKTTKSKFAHKAEAWSVEQLVGSLNNILN